MGARVIIGIATFLRPHGLASTLQSLEAMLPRVKDAEVSIVVVDNDPRGSASSVVEASSIDGRLVVHLVEPTRGIPFARNRVLEHAKGRADFLAFIDDDEVASPDWLAELLRVQHDTGADVVCGPVIPVLPAETPRWVRHGRFFDRPRFPTGHPVEHVATGNVLMRLERVEVSGLRFDQRLRYTGGEDTLFFWEAKALGFTMVWANEALVHETIPASRANFRWLLRRAFRSGATFALCEGIHRRSHAVNSMRVLKGLVRAGQGLGLLALSMGSRVQATKALQRTFLGIGMVVGAIGGRYDEYRETHA